MVVEGLVVDFDGVDEPVVGVELKSAKFSSSNNDAFEAAVVLG